MESNAEFVCLLELVGTIFFDKNDRMVKKFYSCVFVFVLLGVFSGGLFADSSESGTDNAFEKLSVRMKKKKLKGAECEKLGFKEREVHSMEIEYDGYIYALEFRNATDLDLDNLHVECRFFYMVESTWVTFCQKTETERKQKACSFDIAVGAKAKYRTETKPFVLESCSIPSGCYFYNGKAESVEADPEGLWVRVSCENEGGETIIRDFCDPPSLSSRLSWE